MRKWIILFLLPVIAFAIGSNTTSQKIDVIETNTASEITLVDDVRFNTMSANSVPYIDAGKIMQSSIIDQIELEFLDGVSSNVQDQIDTKLDKSLNDGDLYLGNVSNVATGVTMSGEASIVSSGAITLNNDSVIGKLLTGFTSGSGLITSADDILSSIQKLDGNIGLKEDAIASGIASQYWRGDKTFQTLDTNVVPENTNLYFTDTRSISSPLTGFTSGPGTVSATDSILEAIEKLDGNVGAISGTTNEIDVSSGIIGLADNAILPGTDAFIPPKGTTAQRIGTTAGMFRFNSDDDSFEGYTTGGGWGPLGGGTDFWPLTKLTTGAGSFEIGPNSLSAGLEIFANGEGYLDLDGDAVTFKKRPKPNSTNSTDSGEAFASWKDFYLQDIKFYGAGGIAHGSLDSSATGLILDSSIAGGNLFIRSDGDIYTSTDNESTNVGSGLMQFLTGTINFNGNSATSGGISLSTGSNIGTSSTGKTGDVNINTGFVITATATNRSGNINIVSGGNLGTGDSGAMELKSGDVNTGSSGLLTIASGLSASPTAGDSGGIDINTGNLTHASNASTTGSTGLSTGDNLSTNTGKTGSLTIKTGNSSGGNIAADSGSITIKTGTVVGGTRGEIIFDDGSTVADGYVWTSKDANGTGNWEAGGTGANVNLSNVISTSIPEDLVPNPIVSKNLGSSSTTAQWANLYLKAGLRIISGGQTKYAVDLNGIGGSARIFSLSSNPLEIQPAAGQELLIDADADKFVMDTQPTGANVLAVATTGYVDTAVGGGGGGGGDTYAFTSATSIGFVNSTIGSTMTLPEMDTAFTTNASSNPVEITLNGRFTALSILTSAIEGDTSNFCSIRVKRSGTFVSLGDCFSEGRSTSTGTSGIVCSVGTAIDVGASPSTLYTYTVEIFNASSALSFSSKTCNWNGTFTKPTMIIRQAP